MSEELIQLGLTKNGIKLWKYEFYPCKDTNLNQYKQFQIIPNIDYKKYGKRKSDSLLVDRANPNDIRVIVTLEYKKPEDFKTEKQKKEAVEQCNDVCQVLNSKMGIITDGQTFIWINPAKPDKKNDYVDRTSKIKRSYSIIRNEDNQDLTEPFLLQSQPNTDYEKLEDATKNTLDYIERILESVNSSNSTLIKTQQVDPIGLATSVWQDIYTNTGKDPEKCLYNVVELFVFKFLSDLDILKDPNDFKTLYEMYGKGIEPKEVLKYYAKNSRQKIRELFPEGTDGTTIINGTIFVDNRGEPILSQAILFRNSIIKYWKFGKLDNIKREFKTKLFETFLKQSKDKSRLGQFFTPRKVVRAIVEMADVDTLPTGFRICDPFCGVGGFIAEIIIRPSRMKEFYPVNNHIVPSIIYYGFDKGSDSDEERLIILAKANLLIYLSEVIKKNPTLTKKFSRIFNIIFHYLTESNLGTLKLKPRDSNKYNLILTNPPYITSGSKSIKDEIKEVGLQNSYTFNGKGVDGLAIEWIIRNLKPDGKAFIIVREGILRISQNKLLREKITNLCYLNCVISLPEKTFFNTPQKTCILGLTRKKKDSDIQEFPVFTYLVSNIGETLDSYRFEIAGKSDLQKSVELYNAYKGSPSTFPAKEIKDKRCKIQPIKKFAESKNWVIDEWWSKKELIDLGVEEERKILSPSEFREKIQELSTKFKDYDKILESIGK